MFVVYHSDDEVFVTTPDAEADFLDENFDTAESYPVSGRLTEDEWNRLEDLNEDRFLDVDERTEVFEREEVNDLCVRVGVRSALDF